jgi:hypothetical protein
MPNKPSKYPLQIIFVISTGRTGTQAIANYFNQSYQSVTATHEPRPSRRFRVLSNLHLCNKVSTSLVERLLLSARKQILENTTTQIYLEANPFLHGCLPALANAFPGCRVIHVVRDPRTYIPSHINHGVFSGLKGLAGIYFPYWLLKPDYYEKGGSKQWKEMSPQERLGWRWNTINKILDEGSQIFGDHYTRIRFEDLFDKEKSGLITMAKWIKLKDNKSLIEAAARKRHNISRGTSFPPFDAWDNITQQNVLKLCASRMRDYGYLV